MSQVTIHPSTIEGVKRLATTLKREKSITHTRALDAAARVAGFENFRHAQHSLPATLAGRGGRPDQAVFISTYWRDGDASGRETMALQLRRPMPNFLRASHLVGDLRHFRWDADDHLECRHDIRGQLTARNLANKVARTLVFMEVTGLVPAGTREAGTLRRLVSRMPGRDHSSMWVDPSDGFTVAVDEPYQDPTAEFLAERVSWLGGRGLALQVTRWGGLYAPPYSTMCLVAEDGVRLDRIVRCLDGLRFEAPAGTWAGDSGAYAPPFVSPARKASGKPKRGRPAPPRAGEVRRGATPYHIMFSAVVSWRPAQPIPVAAHREAGKLLLALLRVEGLPARIRDSLGIIQSELDEWLQREATANAWSRRNLSGVYYGDRHRRHLPRGLLPTAAVARVAEILDGYPDCSPARAMKRRLATIGRWLTAMPA
ncbi:DUF5623 domain-containing protein [Castellaniella sp.]|uniref:DUF5623 domain-containing protein n=1 Tax=Castellaniella sp. TaxID=1955812 RepID=UPI0025BFF962|nr:DUF5623 domain-containing protein [Castellaniella sp.]